MLRIAICDDMPDQLESIAALTNEYIKTHRLDADIRTFSHPEELLKATELTQFHLYILDIVMPMLSGVLLGTQLRRLDREAQIIYATTAPEFALDSFAANPLGYLVKPVEKEKLNSLLELAISKIGTPEETTLPVKTKDGLRVLNAESIVCCERLKNTVRIMLATGETVESMSIRSTFSEYISPLLSSGQFVQPHISFLINMNRVERLTDKEFIMRGGAVVPISGKLVAQVRKDYLDYVFKGGKSNG